VLDLPSPTLDFCSGSKMVGDGAGETSKCVCFSGDARGAKNVSVVSAGRAWWLRWFAWAFKVHSRSMRLGVGVPVEEWCLGGFVEPCAIGDEAFWARLTATAWRTLSCLALLPVALFVGEDAREGVEGLRRHEGESGWPRCCGRS
jgi:hypothetical protein